MSAATAAAEPPEEPPGSRFKSQGFKVVKKSEVSVDDPWAQASMLVFPKIIAPAFFNLFTTVASKEGTKSSKTLEAAVVLIPWVQISIPPELL